MGVVVEPAYLDEQVTTDRDEPMLRERAATLGAVPSATLAECTCPEWCEHDHENE